MSRRLMDMVLGDLHEERQDTESALAFVFILLVVFICIGVVVLVTT